MKKYLGVTLGIMTALGGFLDLGQIVFTAQAGASTVVVNYYWNRRNHSIHGNVWKDRRCSGWAPSNMTEASRIGQP